MAIVFFFGASILCLLSRVWAGAGWCFLIGALFLPDYGKRRRARRAEGFTELPRTRLFDRPTEADAKLVALLIGAAILTGLLIWAGDIIWFGIRRGNPGWVIGGLVFAGLLVLTGYGTVREGGRQLQGPEVTPDQWQEAQVTPDPSDLEQQLEELRRSAASKAARPRDPRGAPGVVW